MMLLEKIIAALAIIIIILGLCMALQGKTIKALKGDLADTKIELLQAHKKLEEVQFSHEVTVKALEDAIEAKGALVDSKVKVKKGIKNVKTDDVNASRILSDSMWVAYCSGNGDSVNCTTR